MLYSTHQLPATRRAALSASQLLARWALGAELDDQRRREARAYEDALESREQHRLDSLARQLLV
ncbi:hypothetical protein [Agrococcus baldri]|uniref:Uncharacterized protein n=1 Tax=Agrococcus baldri TaxID=153730 RepID=A0AA87REP4_9MICO|nr:hypothetical protein [Agrococcus baldri]GEK79196.1 hypothetical protein ABA31_05470 [Agrococcus baldri]